METETKKCTVFGASKPLPGSQEYQEAERLGTLLASHGISIVCGGYFGTMEAVCKGARSVNNPRVSTEGVVVPSVFLDRPRDGNSYLSTCTHAQSLIERMDRMIHASTVFVILPGLIGSLAELVALWNEDYCKQIGGAHAKRFLVVCWRKPWEKILMDIISTLGLDESYAPMVRFVDNAAEAANEVVDWLERSGGL